MSSTIIEVAIKLLSARPCSEQELRHQLEKEFSSLPEVDARVASAISRLRDLHLVNDKRLAENLAVRYERKGNRFISQALRQKGVSDEVISEALTSLGDEYPRALAEARKKISHKGGDTPEKIKATLYRFLSGRGFSYKAIQAVIEQLNEEGFFSPEETNSF